MCGLPPAQDESMARERRCRDSSSVLSHSELRHLHSPARCMDNRRTYRGIYPRTQTLVRAIYTALR